MTNDEILHHLEYALSHLKQVDTPDGYDEFHKIRATDTIEALMKELKGT